MSSSSDPRSGLRQPSDQVNQKGGGSMYELHQLLWDIRRFPDIKTRYLADPDPVLDSYGIHSKFRDWMTALDFKSLYENGINPYLLYFCAIQLQVDRAAYYSQIRGETP